MGTLLLHNPWVQFYLLYAGALSIALLWDQLRQTLAARHSSQTPRNETAHGESPLLPSSVSKKPPESVWRPGRWSVPCGSR